MNKNQVKGRVKESTGKLKELTGRLFGNKSLEAKGKAQKTTGGVEAGYGDVKSDIKDG